MKIQGGGWSRIIINASGPLPEATPGLARSFYK